MLGPNKYVQRMAITSALGERCILTFTMTATTPPSPPSTAEPGTTAATIADVSVPADQVANAGDSSESGAAGGNVEAGCVWRLKSVRGEPQYGMGAVQPVNPSPELSPEQIVDVHLATLQ